jgi:hypothetical protein
MLLSNHNDIVDVIAQMGGAELKNLNRVIELGNADAMLALSQVCVACARTYDDVRGVRVNRCRTL